MSSTLPGAVTPAAPKKTNDEGARLLESRKTRVRWLTQPTAQLPASKCSAICNHCHSTYPGQRATCTDRSRVKYPGLCAACESVTKTIERLADNGREATA